MRRILTVVIGLAIGMLAVLGGVSCSNKADGKPGGGQGAGLSQSDDYALTQVELSLAQTEKPYMDINLGEKELWLKLKGAVVWSCPLDLSEKDAEASRAFVRKFLGGERRYVRPVVEKHLFSSKEKTPDSVLKIVGEVVKVDPGLLQREIPSRFQLVWEDGLILEVRTDVQGKENSSFKNTLINLSQKLQKPFGEVTLTISMTADEAMTLYRIAGPGFPTMVHPPN